MERAYSLLEIKAVDDEQRVITGIATTPTPDRYGDIVEPKGAEFQLPIPLLWQHKSSEPIGEVFEAKVTANGIEIKARFAKIAEAGKLKDRIDEAWQSVKHKLVRGLSIGFSSIEYSRLENGGMRFLKWAWLELSAVTIPANAEASIATIRSASAALGTEVPDPDRQPAPGDTGKSTGAVYLRQSTSMAKTTGEQIADLANTRAAKNARLNEIQTKATDEGRTKNEQETEEFAMLKSEIAGIDQELKDLRELEEINKAGAVTVKGTTTEEAAVTRGGQPHVVVVNRKADPGILFARYAMCMGAARGIPAEAIRLAKEHYRNDEGVIRLVEKANVTGGSTTGSHYLDDMVPYNVMQDFIEYLRPGSIVGKFGGPNPGGGPAYPSLNRVGFNERVSGMSTGYSAAWTGEGLPAIPSAAVTFNTTLGFHKLAALAVLTKEAIRFSNPSAEAKVRDDIARAINYKMDLDFVDPTNAGTANLKPASITNGIAATAPTGTTAAKFRADLATMVALFATANLDPGDIVLIMSATQALQLSMMVNTLGNNDFDNINMKGGSIRGFPVIVSEHLTNVGSPSTQTIIAVKASDVYLADDGVVTVDASDQASVQMEDSSSMSAISGAGATSVSLWQAGAVGLKATREVTWKLRRSTAVRYISPAAYVAQ